MSVLLDGCFDHHDGHGGPALDGVVHHDPESVAQGTSILLSSADAGADLSLVRDSKDRKGRQQSAAGKLRCLACCG